MQTSKREGMQVIEQDIIDFIYEGDISIDEGLKYANNPKYIKDNISR
jgi:Tfp pilus assembly ATPase PilU